MSVPIRAWPLRKQPVVWCCPCHCCSSAFLLLSLSLSLSLYFFIFVLVCACECLWMMWVTATVGREGCSLSPRGCFWVTASHGSPRPDGFTTSLGSLCQTQTRGQNTVLSRSSRERKDCKPVNIVLYLFYALTALTQSFEETTHKDFFRAYLCFASFCQRQSRFATSNQCPLE